MAEATGAMAADATRTAKPAWWGRWLEWAGYAASLWSLVYAVLIPGLYWGLGSTGFAFGKNDPQSRLSVLDGMQAETGAPIIAALGLVGGAVAMAMAPTHGRGMLRAVLLAFASGTIIGGPE